MNRAGMFLGALALLAFAGAIKVVDNARTYSAEQVHSVAEAAASRLEEPSTPGLDTPFEVDSAVYDTVNDEAGGNVKVRSTGTGEYELTNRKGEHPVCLTATSDDHLNLGADDPWSHSISTSVKDGRC